MAPRRRAAGRGGQPLGARPARPRAAATAGGGARRRRRAGARPRARGHREQRHGRPRDGAARARRGGGDGRHRLDRRLRHRLLVARPAAAAAGAGAQGRPLLRARDGALGGGRADRARHHRDGAQPRAARGRRGCRERRRRRTAARDGLRPWRRATTSASRWKRPSCCGGWGPRAARCGRWGWREGRAASAATSRGTPSPVIARSAATKRSRCCSVEIAAAAPRPRDDGFSRSRRRVGSAHHPLRTSRGRAPRHSHGGRRRRAAGTRPRLTPPLRR